MGTKRQGRARASGIQFKETALAKQSVRRPWGPPQDLARIVPVAIEICSAEGKPTAQRQNGSRRPLSQARQERINWTACETPGRHQGGRKEPFAQPGRHQGGRKGPVGQPTRRQGGRKEPIGQPRGHQGDRKGLVGQPARPGRHQGGRKGPFGQPGRHQGGSREAGRTIWTPGRHQGGRKGPIRQPGRAREAPGRQERTK